MKRQPRKIVIAKERASVVEISRMMLLILLVLLMMRVARASEMRPTKRATTMEGAKEKMNN